MGFSIDWKTWDNTDLHFRTSLENYCSCYKKLCFLDHHQWYENHIESIGNMKCINEFGFVFDWHRDKFQSSLSPFWSKWTADIYFYYTWGKPILNYILSEGFLKVYPTLDEYTDLHFRTSLENQRIKSSTTRLCQKRFLKSNTAFESLHNLRQHRPTLQDIYRELIFVL